MDTLRERIPPWPRQIITPKLITYTLIRTCYNYCYGVVGFCLLIYSSKRSRSPPKFHQFFKTPPWTPPEVSSQFAQNFLSNVAYRQTNKPTPPKPYITRSTQRAQTSLAEADHYSHIAHCKNVEPWWSKTTPPLHTHTHTCTTIWVCYPIIVFVLLI